MSQDKEMRDFLRGVTGVVDANSYETMMLYKEHTERHGEKSWVQGGGGPLETVGTVGDRPVCLSLLINEVSGNRLLFIDPTSQMVDWLLVEGWLQKNLPPSAFRDGDPREPVNRTNAMNFHVVARPVDQVKPQYPVTEDKLPPVASQPLAHFITEYLEGVIRDALRMFAEHPDTPANDKTLAEDYADALDNDTSLMETAADRPA